MQGDGTKTAARICFACCLAAAASFASGVALAQRDLGFSFCPPPFAPKCVSNPATYATQGAMDTCQEDVNRYINSVGAYRLCLMRETERAVRETNGTLQRWKCGLAAKAVCQ
jgi:hypothetical protein